MRSRPVGAWLFVVFIFLCPFFPYGGNEIFVVSAFIAWFVGVRGFALYNVLTVAVSHYSTVTDNSPHFGAYRKSLRNVSKINQDKDTIFLF